MPFLPNMGLAHLQALGLLGFPPFAPLNFLPPNFNPQAPLDLSKSGYEPVVHPDAQVEGTQTMTQESPQVAQEDEAMDDEESSPEQSHPLETVSALLESMEQGSPGSTGSTDQGDSDEQRYVFEIRARIRTNHMLLSFQTR
jgi:hypothetical protein